MKSTAFFNASSSAAGVSLFLDIDSKTEVIKEFFYEGPQVARYQNELEELKSKTLGKKIDQVKHFNRQLLESETRLDNGKLAIASLGMWLFKRALASHLGEGGFLKGQNDLLCLCFSVSKKEIVQKVLTNKDFDLKKLIQDTMATSACGSCRAPIEKLINDTRNEHGLIKGLDHSKSRFDEKGNWIKIAGMYPGPLLIRLDELKKQWMQREGIVGQFEIEFTKIEGFHLEVKINPASEKAVAGLLLALGDYLKSELGILFFLKAA